MKQKKKTVQKKVNQHHCTKFDHIGSYIEERGHKVQVYRCVDCALLHHVALTAPSPQTQPYLIAIDDTDQSQGCLFGMLIGSILATILFLVADYLNYI